MLSILRPRDCLGIGSGLSRDWLGSLSQKFRLELERNWFEIVSGFSRERLGEVGDGFRATFRGPQSSEETSLSEVAWRLEALRSSSSPHRSKATSGAPFFLGGLRIYKKRSSTSWITAFFWGEVFYTITNFILLKQVDIWLPIV